MGQKMTRGQIQDLIGRFALENPKYRSALISNPKGILERQLNTSLGGVTVQGCGRHGRHGARGHSLRPARR